MTDQFDAIVIGGGHNGLVTAAYLGKAGRKVLVLEAAAEVGGAAITREFHAGYSVSACAHILHLMQSKVAKDLKLDLKGKTKAIDTVSLGADGNHLTLTANRISGAGLSDADIAKYPKFKKRMKEFSKLLAPMVMKRPPRVMNQDSKDLKTLMKLGWDLRIGLGRKKMQDFLRVVSINIFDILNEEFDNVQLKGAIALDAVTGHHMGPRTPNSLLMYIYRLVGELNGAMSLPDGGMGTVTQALETAARDAGATIRTNAPVKRIVVDKLACRATGVELEDGEVYSADVIVSSADPKTTLLKLLGARHLEGYFAHRINNIRMKGDACKLHIALNGLPTFTGLDASAHKNRLVIAPTMEHVERAFDHCKYGEYSDDPAIEITIPTLSDPSLAPDGHHVISAVVQYGPYDLKEGWDTAKDAFLAKVIDRIADYAPGIKDQIVATELLTPKDIEKEFRIYGGHWNHGEMTIDQLLMLRPVYDCAQYKTPVDGLWLCGAGAHPGGGVMGAAGHNAAAEILSAEKTS